VTEIAPNPPRLPAIPEGADTCGCCSGVERETPREVVNRAGLRAIAYRIGTYREFRDSLQAGLGDLRTRADGDFTMGLIDAFACAADVLTFYQERIANESYLGTAQEDLSLRELGRLIGYRLRPGVAAETWLAFTFETPPLPPAAAKSEPGTFVTGVPAEVTVAAGLAVRSVPAPGQQPQVFETVEPFTARPAWNALQPWLTEAAYPVKGSTFTYLRGVNTRLHAGDALLFVGGDYLRGASGAASQWDFRIVDDVLVDAAGDRTRASWSEPLASLPPPQSAAAWPQVFALRRRAAVYGHNAPAWGAMSAAFRGDYVTAFPRAAEAGAVSYLARAASAPAREEWPRFAISPVESSVDLDTVYAEISLGSFVVLAHSGVPAAATAVELYRVDSVTEVSREEFGLSAKVTRLALAGADSSRFASAVRTTSVFGQAEPLALAEYPVTTAIADAQVPVDVASDGLLPGRRLLVRGARESDGVPVVHPATLLAAGAAPGRAGGTLLEISPPLQAPLKRASVIVNANVALATHGETVSQILGAGDAATPFQRFELKQAPLTYRAAPTELGAASELTARVDDVAWRERDSLFGAAPQDRAYTLQTDESGRVFVQFGDGASGARPSSGTNNVRATYRKGLGAAGNLAVDSLTQIAQRPLGMKGVTNAVPATGGTDPERADQARRTMPLMTRTLGRAVSLLDYEDFARAFAGVAKARAAVLQIGAGPAIAVTIAGADNAVLTPANPVWKNLAAALAQCGDPHVAVRLLAHRASTFRLGLKVKCDPAHEAARVLDGVESALRARFCFESRALGEPVQQSDVIATAQGVAGVIAVDLDYLYGGTRPASQTQRSRQVRLLAGRMSTAAGAAQPDEILTLDPRPFDRLEEMP
jgi:predicted phage baseplate assembly protein